MGELSEKRWAVISERGAEQIALGYDDAVRLVQQLTREKVRGLVIVTNEAGQQLLPTAESKKSVED